jgi:hypothetical protein
MDRHIEGDELFARLGDLPSIDMDARYARQVRDRSFAVLTRRQRPAARLVEILVAVSGRFLEPALVGALSAGYLAWVVGRCAEAVSQGPGVLF